MNCVMLSAEGGAVWRCELSGQKLDNFLQTLSVIPSTTSSYYCLSVLVVVLSVGMSALLLLLFLCESTCVFNFLVESMFLEETRKAM